VGFGLASSLGVLLLRDPIGAALHNQALSRALLFYVPYPFFAFLTAAMPSALIASGRARLASVLNAVNGLVTVGAVVAAAAISPSTSSMAAGLSLSAGLVALLSTACVVRALRIRGPLAWRSVAWRPLLTYGLPLALTQLATMLGFQFDRLVVSNRFSPGEFAVYALGAVEVPIAIVVQQAVNAVLVPALARLHAAGDRSEMVRQWQAAMRKTSLVVLPLFAFLMVMAGSLITALYGTKFGGSVSIFRAYLFLMPLRMLTYGLITQAIGRTGINLSASLVMLGANVVFALGLVFPLGLLGPAIATPLAMLATVVYYAFRLRAVVSLRLGQLLPWRLLTVNLVIAFASAAPLLALLALHMAALARLAAACAVFLPVYLVALRLTGRLTPTEWDLLRARLPIRARGVLTA
jgi:O-antigen/teichoic acid export membrane protein